MALALEQDDDTVAHALDTFISCLHICFVAEVPKNLCGGGRERSTSNAHGARIVYLLPPIAYMQMTNRLRLQWEPRIICCDKA
jgi:hypothetical protein